MSWVKQGKVNSYELELIRKDGSKYRDGFGAATIYRSGSGGGLIDYDIRDCDVVFLNRKKAINTFSILQSYIIQLYHTIPVPISNVPDIQYTRYKPGQFFGRHHDVIEERAEKCRLFTFSINLSPSEEYEGGSLEVEEGDQKIVLSKTPGSFIVFPSFYLHTAYEVLSGVRECMVVWISSNSEDLQTLKNLCKS